MNLKKDIKVNITDTNPKTFLEKRKIIHALNVEKGHVLNYCKEFQENYYIN